MRPFARARWIFAVYVVLALAVSLHKYHLPLKQVEGRDQWSTEYNNYVIFQRSGAHLLAGHDLYREYPDEYWDLFKYSPSFALATVPLGWLPDWLGLCVWNVTNALVLVAGLLALPLGQRAKGLVSWLVLKEFLTSVSNSQSNGLVAGLVVLTVAALERDSGLWAGLCLAASFYLKIYGAAAGILFILYPCRWRAGAWSAVWLLALGALPLVAVPADQLLGQYRGWLAILSSDHQISYGLSVMGVAEAWFGLRGIDAWLALAGIVGLLVPLTRVRQYGDQNFRLGMLASLMVWMVIFNHKAESPTYIVAVTGLAIWYVTAQPSRFDLALLGTAFVLTCWTQTDLFPRAVRRTVIGPYRIKAIGSLLLWPRVVFYQLFRTAQRPVVEIPTPELAPQLSRAA